MCTKSATVFRGDADTVMTDSPVVYTVRQVIFSQVRFAWGAGSDKIVPYLPSPDVQRCSRFHRPGH
ncbi:hypothetical protein MCEMAEM21_02578 [Oxalobacteraceae bacterium]|jgi:hypothetical protein